MERRIGIRSVALLQEPIAEEAGTSFVVSVNGRPTFCGGANWIPADVFLPRVDAARYRAWVQLAADAGMNMLRVWGGGTYEADAFYDACDELGVLVWQDFMFACGMYPANEAFLETITVEAEAAVRRLRSHPSIALWCGNNEDHLLAYREALEAPFPARVIYEHVLPEVCERLDPGRPYWPGSPYGGTDPNDPTQGDRHTWEVWHGELAPIRDYPLHEGRFVSEFGMLSAPHPATIASFAPPSERTPMSPTVAWHLKADGGAERVAHYLRSLPEPVDLEGWVHATQVVQADAMTTAITAWRRRWGVPGHRAVGGALVWQLNDCWPALSWSLVDHLLRPKGAWYAVGRALAPLALGIAEPLDAPAVWAMNATDDPVEGTVHVDAWSHDGSRIGQLVAWVSARAQRDDRARDVRRCAGADRAAL